jgi:hypothetical protein
MGGASKVPEARAAAVVQQRAVRGQPRVAKRHDGAVALRADLALPAVRDAVEKDVRAEPRDTRLAHLPPAACVQAALRGVAKDRLGVVVVPELALDLLAPLVERDALLDGVGGAVENALDLRQVKPAANPKGAPAGFAAQPLSLFLAQNRELEEVVRGLVEPLRVCRDLKSHGVYSSKAR